MSFPRYSTRKSSELEWIGEVPSHWRTEPLYSVASERSESNAGMVEENLLSLSYGYIVRKDIESNDGLLPESFETYQVVHPNDIVLRLTDLQNDKRSLRSAIAREKGIITSAYLCLFPEGVVPTYLAYLLRSYDSCKVFYSMGGGLRQSMKFADLKRLPVVVPPEDEQAAIVSFLDNEISKIDALLAEQQRLIALLKEKRQAVISHAVTKGLNPDAPMKCSGIEWLGVVPAHWRTVPLKHLVSFQSGGTPSKGNAAYWLGAVPWASAKDMKSEVLDDTVDHLAQYAINDGAASLVPTNSVVVVVRGMILARVFPVTLLAVPMAINQDLKALLPSEAVDAKFLAWYLRGTESESLNRLDEAGHGTKALRMETWSSLAVTVPPKSEQKKIAEFLDLSTERLDALVMEAETAIGLLAERRSALISAAVTGQIDVQGLAS